MKSTQDFLKVVFDYETDSTCFAAHNKGTTVSKVGEFKQTEYFCINALDAEVDNEPSEPWHHFSVPRRANINVTKHRTFLLEFDAGTGHEQDAIVTASGVPYSACTFSGSKSRHYLITLETPLRSKYEYDTVAKRLFKAFEGQVGFDTSTKNCSRLSRLPGTVRSSTGLKQTLISLNGQVNNELFFKWLDKHSPAASKPKHPSMSPETRLLLMGIQTRDTVATAYNAVLNLQELGQSNEAIRAKILKAAPGTEAIVDGAINKISLKDLRAEINTLEELLQFLSTHRFLGETFLRADQWASANGNYDRLFRSVLWLAEEYKVCPTVIEQLYTEVTAPALEDVGYSQHQINHALKTSIAKAQQIWCSL
jgi:hypothetical protein